MKLIDVDDVISLLVNHHFDDNKENFDLLIHNLCKEIRQIPIAYDVDEVVKQLKEWTFNADVNIGDVTITNHDLISSKNAIEIVKDGGVDGN